MFLSWPVLCSYTLLGLVVIWESEKDGKDCSTCPPLSHCMFSFLFGDSYCVIDKSVTTHPLSWYISLLTLWHVVLKFKSNTLSFFYPWHCNNAIIFFLKFHHWSSCPHLSVLMVVQCAAAAGLEGTTYRMSCLAVTRAASAMTPLARY
jgi:hypothetical protein